MKKSIFVAVIAVISLTSCGPKMFHDYQVIKLQSTDSVEYENWKAKYPKEYAKHQWRVKKDTALLNPKNQ